MDHMYQATFRGYAGGRRWVVSSSANKTHLIVRAPTAEAAIAAAAERWGERWQDQEFYEGVNVGKA